MARVRYLSFNYFLLKLFPRIQFPRNQDSKGNLKLTSRITFLPRSGYYLFAKNIYLSFKSVHKKLSLVWPGNSYTLFTLMITSAVDKGSFFNYVDQIWPIIDHLPKGGLISESNGRFSNCPKMC